MPRRRLVLFSVLGLAAAVPAAWFVWGVATFPSDQTPEGAYLRLVKAVNLGSPEACFAYLETPAQHACFTLRDFRRRSRELVLAAYPEPERTRLAELYRAHADCPDGADVFALEARRRGWLDRLRRDLSGVRRVTIEGERATVETAMGTRYPFRRRDNGIWGLTLFTSTLTAEAERAARDHGIIERAAADYRRGQAAPAASAPP